MKDFIELLGIIAVSVVLVVVGLAAAVIVGAIGAFILACMLPFVVVAALVRLIKRIADVLVAAFTGRKRDA